MSDQAASDLTNAVQRYFELMYDCDTTYFDEVFRQTAQLHGFRDGEMTMWPAHTYKDILAKRTSPKSLGAMRDERILLLDFASPTQALVKLRVRINTAVFIDYLTFHKIEGNWLITSKAYHLEANV
ncbi:MAG: nuclear transport factor 2 family protein [Methylobacteriaceae bacterium]|nr:nuclear transport factor 2 family protein [Methylobacteriaceae bacterium]